MRKYLLLFISLACLSASAFSQALTMPPSGDNQKASVTQYIGNIVKVTVNYSSPDVHAPSGEDRTGKIWGTLVPYGLTDLGYGLGEPAPWRAGANENTTIYFSHDVLIEGKPLAAGKYGLHLIVEPTGPWTWIFSKNNSAWGSYFYTQKEDALRVQVEPRDNNHTEYLTYTFTERKPESAVLELQWEKKAIPMRISVPNTMELYAEQIDKELQSSPGFDPDNYAAAANFLLRQNYNLERALVYANKAIEAPTGIMTFSGISTKANVLLKMGKSDEASKVITAAMDMPDATAGAVHQFGRNVLISGDKQMAMKIFQMNYDKHNGAWPTTVGMTRGLSALGKYDEALKYAMIAQTQAPDDLNKNSLTNMIEKLKASQDIN